MQNLCLLVSVHPSMLPSTFLRITIEDERQNIEGENCKICKSRNSLNNETKHHAGIIYYNFRLRLETQAPTPTDFPAPPNPGNISKALAASCLLTSSMASLALRAFAPRGKLLPAAPSLTKSILWITKDMPS